MPLLNDGLNVTHSGVVHPAITSPTNGASLVPVFDIVGTAPPGSTVELWTSDRANATTPNATTTAGPEGKWRFRGDTPAKDGTVTWWVVADGVESAHITFTVVTPRLTSPPGGSTQPPIFDLAGVAPAASEVSLHADTGSEPGRVLSTTLAKADGTFAFAGDHKAAEGTYDWWVSVDGYESEHLPLTVETGDAVVDLTKEN